MREIHAFNPDSEYFLNPSYLKPISPLYSLDYELLCMESTLAKHTLQKAEMTSVGHAFLELTPLKAAFPNLLKAMAADCSRQMIVIARSN